MSNTTPLAQAIIFALRHLQANSPYGACIHHTPEGLLTFLKRHGGPSTNHENFPANTRALGRQLSAHASKLAPNGIVIKANRSKTVGRFWTIATEEDYHPLTNF